MEGAFVQDRKGQLLESRMEEFIQDQVIRRGSDERTVKAYRLDLEHFYRWLGERQMEGLDQAAMESYLEYLLKGKKLRSSTVTRKCRVLDQYLGYLSGHGLLSDRRPLSSPVQAGKRDGGKELLSKSEIDLFFGVIDREYEELESDFRKRICLRDSIMMELLFYHGLEISELLRLRLSDHDEKTGVLLIRGKREKVRSVPLFSRRLRDRLKLWLREHAYFEKEEDFRDWMFLSKLGKPLSMKMVICIFDKYRVMAGIQKEATPKDLKGSMERYARELLMERCG